MKQNDISVEANGRTVPVGSKAPDNLLTIKGHDPEQNLVFFGTGMPENTKEILKLTSEGMFYRGEFVEDAGAAHKAWLDTMDEMVLRGTLRMVDSALDGNPEAVAKLARLYRDVAAKYLAATSGSEVCDDRTCLGCRIQDTLLDVERKHQLPPYNGKFSA